MKTPWEKEQAYRRKEKFKVALGVIAMFTWPLPFFGLSYVLGYAGWPILICLSIVPSLFIASIVMGIRDRLMRRKHPSVIIRESFNARLRDECLNLELFWGIEDLNKARRVAS